ncbi:MAG: glycosyltransferase family A protein [Pseudomonadota bacterium]
MTYTKFSVVVPLYNKKRNICRCIRSVFAQTHAADELIVVDDGSTDGSADLLQKVFGHQVTLIRQPNGGVSRARNAGIHAARNRYVALIDADDEWHPTFLQEITRLRSQFPDADLFGTAYEFRQGYKKSMPNLKKTSGETQLIIEDYFDRISQHDLLFNASSVCIDRQFIVEHGGFPEGEPMGEDQDLWNRVALNGKIAYSAKSLAIYHLAADNRVCLSDVPKKECPFSQRLETIARCAPPKLARQLRECSASHILDLAKRNYLCGDIVAAKHLLRDKRTNLLARRKAYWWIRTILASIRFHASWSD